MLRSDSPLYIQPRPDPELLRWLVAFWRRCNPRDFARGQAALLALNRRTEELYEQLQAEGVAFESHRAPALTVYLDRSEYRRDWQALEPMRAAGHPSLALEGAQLRSQEPELADAVVAGILTPGDRHVRPESLMAGLAARLAADGVELRAGAPVTGIERRGPRALAVNTPAGRVEADAVVLSAGAWTPRLARLVGASVPIQAGKGYSLDYAPAPRPLRQAMVLHEARVGVTPTSGRVRLGGTMELSGVNERLSRRRIEAIARGAQRYFRHWPAGLAGVSVWTGMRPVTPDGLPVIGRLPGFDNLFLAGGHGMFGVTLGPSTGEAIAELIATGRAPDLLRPFDPARFA
jgi:D-amino-acid dehydrogenase